MWTSVKSKFPHDSNLFPVPNDLSYAEFTVIVQPKDGRIRISPVGDMVNEVLFEHVAPAFDDVEDRLFERFGVDAEPAFKQRRSLHQLNLLVNLLIRINL